jgi:hypothetical protein
MLGYNDQEVGEIRMYFWRIEELKARLRKSPLREREVLPYLLIFLVVNELASLIPPSTMNFWDYAAVVCGAVLTIFGTMYVYKMNGGNEGSHFLRRYLSLGWVVVIRVVAFALPGFAVLSLLFEQPRQTDAISFGYFAAVWILLYQQLGKHVRDVAGALNMQATGSE